jgi:hypothetical protein
MTASACLPFIKNSYVLFSLASDVSFLAIMNSCIHYLMSSDNEIFIEGSRLPFPGVVKVFSQGFVLFVHQMPGATFMQPAPLPRHRRIIATSTASQSRQRNFTITLDHDLALFALNIIPLASRNY